MSIGIGTLQPRARVMRPVWLAALLTLFVALTLAVVVANSGEETVREETTTVSGTAANTPTELRGGIVSSTVSGTAANTPTELRGGLPAPAAAYQPIVVNGDVCGQCR